LRNDANGGIAVLDHSQPHEEQRAQQLGWRRSSVVLLFFWGGRYLIDNEKKHVFFLRCD
jgi:hypothetical protein